MFVFGPNVTPICVQVHSEVEGYKVSKGAENRPFDTFRYPLVSLPMTIDSNYAISYVAGAVTVSKGGNSKTGGHYGLINDDRCPQSIGVVAIVDWHKAEANKLTPIGLESYFCSYLESLPCG